MDNYEIIGTTRNAVEIDVQRKRARNLEEQNKFVKNKFNKMLEMLQYAKNMNTSPEKIQQIEEQIERVKKAYEEIESPILRVLYNRKLDNNKKIIFCKEENNSAGIRSNAYETLDITRKSCQMRSEQENDKIIKQNKEKLERFYSSLITQKSTFSDREKIDLELEKISESYELIKTADMRKQYNEELDRQEQEIKERKRKNAIKEKYCHISEYNPELIDTFKTGEKQEEKAVAKRLTENSPIIYLRGKRNIHLRKISEIAFRNCTGIVTSYINGYEVTRDVDGEEVKNIVYTNLLLPELAINKETEEPLNKKYYDCVINKLLSEDTIEGSKYNNGYIGMVEQDENGDYDITLGKEKLNSSEQEMLTAVMIIQEREEVSIEGECQEEWEK